MSYRFLLSLYFLSIQSSAGANPIPAELREFTPYAGNPVFQGAGPGHWDEFIRERGWILVEDGVYYLWYTGYSRDDDVKKLGLATSSDGLHWERHSDNPIYTDRWVEDMTVVKHNGRYNMFAEGENDEAYRLSSIDRIHWVYEGKLDIRLTNGDPISPGPYGTPTVFVESETWYLFYEREDEAIWLAMSTDENVWTNVQDEPVCERGPGDYDQAMIAFDQIVKWKGRYYVYYHGLVPNTRPQDWTSALAVSDDFIHWEKFEGNPLVAGDKSSPQIVADGERFRLYTMHPSVNVYLPKR